jgi:ribonuclease-3
MSSSADALAELQQALHYTFLDSSLLALALRHKSAGQPNNERLEFLGDAILGAIVAEALYKTPSSMEEGSLTVARASLVNGSALAELAKSLKLECLIQLGKGERQGKNVRASILEDAVEAIVGAIFLDADFESAKNVVLRLLDKKLALVSAGGMEKDPKTRLQELMQAQKSSLPQYRIVEQEGPPHDRIFTIACYLADSSIETVASARSRRAAEQSAAKAMLEKINDTNGS